MFQTLTHFFVTQSSEGDNQLTLLGYAALIALMVIIIVLVPSSPKGKSSQAENRKIRTRQMVFSAVSMALAMILSFIKPLSLPFGGSVTFFSMFFISFIGSLYGLKAGLMTGFAYGILQLIADPFIYHPIQLLLDYPLAFACLGLSGLMPITETQVGSKKNLLVRLSVGYGIGVIGRYICHSLSGYIFFKEYAGDMNPILYTLGYNSTYLAPELVLTIVVLCLPPVTKAILELRKIALLD